MKEPFFELKENSFIMRAQDTIPPSPEFKYPTHPITGEVFPNCCSTHKDLANDLEQWFIKFPNCCEGHKNIAKNPLFSKEDYKYVPEKVLRQIIYTESFLTNMVDSPDWYKEITDYIEANEHSFGAPAIGYDHYSHYIINYIRTNPNLNLSEEKRKKLLDYFTPNPTSAPRANLNILYSTYQKWLKIFPFDLSIFNGLKEEFTKQLPFLTSQEFEYNKYSGFTKAKLHTEESLVHVLINTTKKILSLVETNNLLNQGNIKDTEKYQVELINESHRIKQAELLKKFSNGETGYIRILKKWLNNEKTYMREISPFFKGTIADKTETKGSKLKDDFRKHDFFELEKTKILSTANRDKLIELIAGNKLPYQVAMLDYLGFIIYLEMKYFNSKYKVYKELSKWLNSDKDGRSVKANVASLSKVSTENRKRYTAYLHKETVQKDYKQLK